MQLGLDVIAEAVKGRLYGSGAAYITSVSTDSRYIESNDLFIAIRGDMFDGHDYLDTVFDKGAVCAIIEENSGESHFSSGKNLITVKNTKQALLDLAHYYRSLSDVKIIAITGSVGKTTTKEFCGCIMQMKYKTHKTDKNYNNEIGLPKTILSMPKDTEAAVLELGMSSFGEISKMSVCATPDIGIIINIGTSHIEYLGSREGIAIAKLELIDGMNIGSYLIINGDEKLLTSKTTQIREKGINVVTCSFTDKKADYYADNIKIEEKTFSTSFDLYNKGQFIINASIPAAGLHNVQDALYAIAAGEICGIDYNTAICGLSGYVPLKMRQNIYSYKNLTIIEDCYNASPESMKAAFSVMRDMNSKNKIAVLADVLELGSYSEELHKQIGEDAKLFGIDKIYAYGKNSVYISKGFGGDKNFLYFNDKDSLVCSLSADVKDGDIILFKSSRGMKMEETLEKFKIIY